MDWIEIKNQNDIEKLLAEYGDFHDSCIVALSYKSGAYVDNETKAMGFGKASDRELYVTFQRQWEPVELELCFTGVRRLHLVGWQDNYFCDIADCYLAIHHNLLPGTPKEVIVWADTDSFDLARVSESNRIAEPADTYIISNNLKWRIVNK